MYAPPARKRPLGPSLALPGRPSPPTTPGTSASDGPDRDTISPLRTTAPSYATQRSRTPLALPKLGPIRPGSYRSQSDDSGAGEEVPPWETQKPRPSSSGSGTSVYNDDGHDAVKRRVSELQGAVAGLHIGVSGHAPPGPISSSSSSSSRTSLPLNEPQPSAVAPTSSGTDARRPSSSSGRSDPTAAAAPAHVDPDDVEDVGRLGEGAAGEVRKVRLRSTGEVLAKKTIGASPDPAVHKQILRELAFLRECDAPFIVKYHGAFLEDIAILMDFCEGGSLDAIYKAVKARGGRMGEKILGKVGEAVLHALVYLHERKIIHRDLKPSNILASKDGLIKLCDFGVSGQLVNSFAATFTGTSYYMAPERIQGLSYTITSDVWSLGLTLHELAANRFPFPPEGESSMPLGPIELLSYIVKLDPPVLHDDAQATWTRAIKDFLRLCLEKDGKVRPTPQVLLKHPWIVKSEARVVDVHAFLANVWEWTD